MSMELSMRKAPRRFKRLNKDQRPRMHNFLHDDCGSSLILFEFPKEDDNSKLCELCRKEVSGGWGYRCSDCDLVFHKYCAEIPGEIQSFFHPCVLRGRYKTGSFGFYYSCSACFGECIGLFYCCGRCGFYMHVECAQEHPTTESQELIQHFIHRHYLVLIDPNKHFEVECGICDKFCSASASASTSDSSAYGCEGCNFFVHSSCMRSIPREMNDPLHMSCHLALLTVFNYVCGGCDEAASGAIRHSAHKHPLVPRESKEFDHEIRCKACGGICLLDPCLGCNRRSCNFFLHKKCADELQTEIRHPFHSQHPLALLPDLPNRCKVCDEDGSSLAYCCVDCKFQLHLKCALFATIESKDADKILHGAHKHPLEIHEFGNEVPCRACAKSCLAPCFGCKECNFFLHKTCAVEVQEKVICHPFHPLHPLTLSSPTSLPQRETFRCSSCLGSVDCNLLHYRCAKCDFNLHIDCVKPKLTVPGIKYEGHRHPLFYFDKTLAPTQCNICRDDAQTCFFRCLACAFNVHIHCIPSTPKTIQHQCHIHPLTVTESPFEHELISLEHEDGSDDHEFYCDACEEKRNNFESVYYCAECKFIAEVPCVISEVLPPLLQRTAESTNVYRDEENSEAIIKKLSNKIRNYESQRGYVEKSVERCQKELQKLEKELEQKNRKIEKLTTDKFLYQYHVLN